MTYLLDTNVCIRYLNGRSPGMLQRLQKLQPVEVAVCSVVKAELFYDAQRSHNPTDSLAVQRQFLQPYRSLPFDDAAAEIAGSLRAQLAERGTPIGPYDLQIAAIALANDCTLVTHNVRSSAACRTWPSKIGKLPDKPGAASWRISPQGMVDGRFPPGYNANKLRTDNK